MNQTYNKVCVADHMVEGPKGSLSLPSATSSLNYNLNGIFKMCAKETSKT